MDLDADSLISAFNVNLSISPCDNEATLSSLLCSSLHISRGPDYAEEFYPSQPSPPPSQEPAFPSETIFPSETAFPSETPPWQAGNQAHVVEDGVCWSDLPDSSTSISEHHRFGMPSLLTSEHLGLGVVNVEATGVRAEGARIGTGAAALSRPVFGMATTGTDVYSFAALACAPNSSPLLFASPVNCGYPVSPSDKDGCGHRWREAPSPFVQATEDDEMCDDGTV
ncbi:hypothetical protein BC936DRAFT_145312 [Jimgerdemannia flammicorona]|uniref:Uncharacterized protein n=1 Tax=Jimgerdemannia flammicorona TaxID=994334 RepID=A0A433DAB6_9FUNG|nr:hypothetical protein BC936DRAFT_145312 [Jimgerdemannia flammicorona]